MSTTTAGTTIATGARPTTTNKTTKTTSTHPSFRTKEERIDLLKKIENYLTSKFAVCCGRDTNDNDYASLIEFWTDRGLLVSQEQDCCDNNRNSNNDDGDCNEELVGEGSNSSSNSSNSNKNISSPSSSLWYQASHNFWENQTNAPATVDGMLGGFSVLHFLDLRASRDFVESILQFRHLNLNLNTHPSSESGEDGNSNKNTIDISTNSNDNGNGNKKTNNGSNTSRSCECGAGIGRITKGLMIPLGIESCDLVETSPRLLQCAKEYIGHGDKDTKINFINSGLQNFDPPENTYDIIWVQWVIGYLTDWDLVSFLYRMGRALKDGGVIVIKDNTCNELAFLADCNDSDITRSFKYLMAIVELSGLRVLECPLSDSSNANKDGKQVMIRWQEDFPDDIWPVPMICLTRG